MTLSGNLNCSPFEIFDQDMDEVILLINFYLELGESSDYQNNKKNHVPNMKYGKNERIRVNDKTATGGWF